MTKAIRIYETGGPEVLRWEDYDPGQPAAGEALVRHEAVGLNFIDVYHRTGIHCRPCLPITLPISSLLTNNSITEVRPPLLTSSISI